jgi:mannose-1-phosphate guanylyltransferase
MAIEQAVILAGGLGTRMRPMTEQVPKPMLPVSGRPFLHHQLRLLQRHGLRRVLLLVAYLGEQIERHFSDGSALGMQIDYSYESSPMGTGGALKNAEKKLDPEFVVLNGDTYLDVPYQQLFASFKSCHCQGLIVAFENAALTLKNNLAVTIDGTVAAYSKREVSGITFTHVDAGATVFKKDVLQNIPEGQKCSLEEDIFPVLIKKKQLSAWGTPESFIDMGSATGLATLEEKLR